MTFDAFLRAKVAQHAAERRDEIRGYVALLQTPGVAFIGEFRQVMDEEIASALGRAERHDLLVQKLGRMAEAATSAVGCESAPHPALASAA